MFFHQTLKFYRAQIHQYQASQFIFFIYLLKERAKELGKKGLEGIRSLFGARAAEAGPLVDFIKSKKIPVVDPNNSR